MQEEAELIAAIANGDGDGLERLLDDIAGIEKVLNERIESRKPTNHCVGHGMTLLQFAALRPNGQPYDRVIALL